MALPPPKRVEMGAFYPVLGRNGIIRSGRVHDPAMMLSVTAIGREVPARGRSYAPAFCGWCLPCLFLAIELETCVGHATYTRLGVCHPEEIAMPASKKQLVCQDFLCSFIKHLLIFF